MNTEELTDAISEVLYDSLEMDWSTTDGARAVVANVPAVAAIPDLISALKGAIGALQFSRDYHSDLGNEEQAFAQDKLDAATSALAKAGAA